MKALQKFSPEYLEQCKQMQPKEIVQFLEDFRVLHLTLAQSNLKLKSKLISIKIPESLLGAFRKKAELAGVPYQTQIKILMKEWLSL